MTQVIHAVMQDPDDQNVIRYGHIEYNMRLLADAAETGCDLFCAPA